MVLYGIIIVALLTLLSDFYIYNQIRNRSNNAKKWSIIYGVSACVVYLIVVSAFGCYKSILKYNDANGLHLIMTVILLFLLTFIPKVIWTVASLAGKLYEIISKQKTRFFDIVGSALAAGALAMMIYGATKGRSEIEVRHITISSDRIPKAFDGFRIAQFSDLHLGSLFNLDRSLRTMVDSLNAITPDVVVQTGDLVNMSATELTPEVLEILSTIKAPYGVFASIGNHDLGYYIPQSADMTAEQSLIELCVKQRSMGWNLLNDESSYIYKDGDSILITGITFPDGYRHNGHTRSLNNPTLLTLYDSIPRPVFKIALSHAPQLSDQIPADVTMSGHVHSMQMKFTIGKHAFSPASWFYKKWSGLYQQGNKYLYINDGIGYVMYPMRIGTRPEITLFTLRRR